MEQAIGALPVLGLPFKVVPRLDIGPDVTVKLVYVLLCICAWPHECKGTSPDFGELRMVAVASQHGEEMLEI